MTIATPRSVVQSRPQHSHQAHQFQAATDVFLVRALEELDLGFFLHVGADQARSGKILLRARGDVGEHGLDPFEAIVNLSAEILNDDADDRQRQEGVQRELRADAQHEHQATAVKTRVLAEYMIPGPPACARRSGRWSCGP